MTVKCKKCQHENLFGTMYCTNCGAKIYDQTQSQGSVSSGVSSKASSPPSSNYNKPRAFSQPLAHTLTSPGVSSDKRYGALRSIAGVMSTLAAIYAAGMAIFGLVSACTTRDLTDSWLASLGTILLFGLGGAIGYLILKAISESIYVIIDIEENTRRSHQAMETLVDQAKRK
jgi:hypothetical protein